MHDGSTGRDSAGRCLRVREALVDCASRAGQGWPALFEGLKPLNSSRPETRASQDASCSNAGRAFNQHLLRLGGSGHAGRWGPVTLLVLLVGTLCGCASSGDRRTGVAATGADDGSMIPDAIPRVEPRSRSGNPESYEVRGKRYFTQKTSAGHVERGLASWYGRAFHGRKTSSGERYDMYAMTAAHKTLPLPTYVQVTNMENGRTAVVKVNDRGPFHGRRVIDLSYSAAKKLGVIQNGTAMVEVRAIDPARPARESGPFLAAKDTARVKRREASAATDRSPEPVSTPAPALTAASADAQEATPKERAAVAAVEASPAAPVPQTPTTAPSGQGPVTVAKAPAPSLYLQVGAFGDPSNAERLRQRLLATMPGRVRVQRSAFGESALYKVRIGPLGSEGEAKAVSAKLVTLGVEPPRRVWN